MTSSHHGPYVQGYTRATMAGTKGRETRKVEPIPKTGPQFGLQSATRLHEVGIASNRGSACAVNTFPGLVHTARQATKVGECLEVVELTRGRQDCRHGVRVR